MSEKEVKDVRFPDNLELKGRVVASGITITDLAEQLGVSRLVVSTTLNGHKKGINIVPAIEKVLEVRSGVVPVMDEASEIQEGIVPAVDQESESK